MRVSSPSSTSSVAAPARWLVLLGTAALLFFVIVLITGGVSLDAGPFHLSAHRWRDPLVVALVAWLAAAFVSRGALLDVTRGVHEWLDAHATAIALVVAAGATGVGVAYGTYAAAGADAAGYISQAALISTAHTSLAEPLAGELGPWPEGGWAVTPLGYRPGPAAGELVPTYPPGLPMLMAAAQLVGGSLAPYLVVPVLGGFAVFFTFVLGARLFSRAAGVAAAMLLATSPIFLFQVVQPMSDVPVTAWWLLALVFATTPAAAAAVAAGATSGLAVLTRPNLLPLALAVLATMVVRRSESRPRCLAEFFAGLAPAIGALGLLQWRLYGSPLASGYGSVDELFTVASLVPNALAYAQRMLRGELPALALLAVSIALLAVPHGTSQPRSRQGPSIVPTVTLAAATAAIVLACYLPYAVFAEWFYLRFLLPALPFLFIAIASVAVAAASRLIPDLASIGLLIAVTAVAAFNVRIAAREQAFHLRDFDARYRLAGEYLAAALPANAVIVTVQESGSLHHYTGRPIVRWDAADFDLEKTLATLAAGQHSPVLVIEDWEAAAFRDRFPTSTAARLDWPPRATIPGTSIVRIYDPAVRDAAAPHVVDVVR